MALHTLPVLVVSGNQGRYTVRLELGETSMRPVAATVSITTLPWPDGLYYRSKDGPMRAPNHLSYPNRHFLAVARTACIRSWLDGGEAQVSASDRLSPRFCFLFRHAHPLCDSAALRHLRGTD